MDLVYLKKIMKIFDESNVSELKIDEEGLKIHLSKTTRGTISTGNYIQPALSQVQPQAVHHQTETPVPHHIPAITPADDSTSDNSGMHTVASPIVGTFYRSPSPDSPAFVEIGSKVTKGQTLCIIEAMKLMNEIESDADGIIEKILVQNSQPIEYNQPLFIIRPA